MNRLAYRHATVEDLPFILGLIVADTVVPSIDDPAAAHPGYAAALAAIDADPNQEMLVAEFEEQPIGCFQLSFIPGLMRRGMWRGLIEAVHVRADRHNAGFGTEMMRWAIERCRERSCGLVQLTSNKARQDAHRFYVRLGFSQSHEGFKLLL